jgi:basic amino acid/polyamine antiporter, APA family
MSQLFATKSMEQLRAEAAETGEHSLKRVLGPVNLITLGIGAIIGTGIFVLTGQAAAQYAGPAIVLSMILAGVASALAGLCYAEFASTVPIAGSAYTYGYATLGEFFAWIIGWDLILEYALGAATVAVGWSGYVVSFLADFGITMPPAFTAPLGAKMVQTSPGHWQILAANLADQLTRQGIDPASLPTVTGIINLPAILIALLVTCLLIVGIKESANVNSVIVIVKVAVVLLVIVAGAAFVKTANWHPFIPQNKGSFGDFGWSGIARGAGVIFFAYIGFDAVSTAAQEAKNPQRDMPIGILGSLVLCTVLYVAVSLVMVGLVPYTQLGVAAPMAVAIDAARVQAQGSSISWLIDILPFLVKLGAIAGLSSVMVVMMLAQPRIFYSMAHDGLLPPWAKKIHPRFRTPHITTIATGVAVATAAGFTPITILGELVSVGTLLAFVIVSIGIIFLRYKRPDIKAPFRTPLVPLVPILSAAVSLSLMASLPLPTWERLVIWMGIGLLIYFGYGYRHSELRKRLEARAGK